MEKIIIVGGGIAGLTCLNALIDAGLDPLLIEGGTIGSPKMCGEFIAPPAISILENWQVEDLQTITQARFFSKNTSFIVNFSRPAGALTRSAAEIFLAKRAIKKHGRIRQNALIHSVTPATKKEPFSFILSTGEEIKAQTAFFATGRFGHKKSIHLPYLGLKTHCNIILEPNTLLMHSEKNAYFGVVPISSSQSNFACLIKKNVLQLKETGKNYIAKKIKENALLNQVFENIDFETINMLETPCPEFFLRKNPLWPDAYWIGDALASLPPAIGYGFAHSINSALLAAECFVESKKRSCLKKLKKRVQPNLLIGKVMHYSLLRPEICSWLFPFLKANPWISKMCLKKLGYD